MLGIAMKNYKEFLKKCMTPDENQKTPRFKNVTRRNLRKIQCQNIRNVVWQQEVKFSIGNVDGWKDGEYFGQDGKSIKAKKKD